MSPLGAFIVCDSPIEEGAIIVLKIDVPVALGGSIPSRISASAKVVRDGMGADHAGRYGHGIMFDHLSFTRL
jgi:hypothetical protein